MALYHRTAVRTSNPTCDSFLEQRINITVPVKVKKNTTHMRKILQQVYGEGRIVEYRIFTTIKPQEINEISGYPSISTRLER
jgi:hypothetical protein